MKSINKRFYCRDCSHAFERVVLENVMTAVCPKCRPIAAFLELLGLTPEQAIVLTLVGAGIAYVAQK